jgi:hypothetical protein
MKAAQNVPLVANPEQITATHWPNVATDHNLPFRHALTEASIGALLILALIIGGLIVAGVREPSVWGLALFVTLVMFLYTLLKRYEDHIAYVRSDRRPVVEPDLDADGKPDRMHGVWYGNGAPPAAAGSLDNAYRRRFAEFCAACRAGDTNVRYLRSSGFDDGLQTLFRSWLMQYQAANWISAAGHNPGWELGEETTLRRVLRNTAWAEGE